MKKITLSIITIILFSFLAATQITKEFNLKWSESLKISNPKIIGESNNAYQLGNVGAISSFSSKNLIVEFNKVIQKQKGRDWQILDLFLYNKKISIISTFINKKEQKQYYHFHNIDEKGNLINTKLLDVTDWFKMTLKYITNPEYQAAEMEKMQGSSWNTFQYCISENNLNLMVMKNGKKSTYEKPIYEVKLFDENLNMINSSDLDYPSGEFMSYKNKLSNKGELLIIGYHYKQNMQGGFANGHAAILSSARYPFKGNRNVIYDYTKDILVPISYKILVHKIESGAKTFIYTPKLTHEIEDLDFEIIDGKTITLYGLTLDKKMNYINGYFISNIELSNYEENFILEKLFEKEHIKDYIDNAENKNEINNLLMHKLVVSKDGSIYMFAEKYRTYVNEVADYHMQSHLGDIVVVKINTAGKEVWQDKVIKHQYSNFSADFLSFYPYTIDNSLFFIHNDNEENVLQMYGAKFEGEYDPAKKIVVAITKMKANGDIETEILKQNGNNSNYYLMPRKSFKVAHNKILLLSRPIELTPLNCKFGALTF